MFLTVLYIPISITATLCHTNKSTEKIENIHKRCLRLTLNDYKSDYRTVGRESMKIRRIKMLATEIYQMKNTFPFYIILQVLKELLIKICKIYTATRS